jgi:peptidoglycan hydrolase CwlO-like protein
MSRVVVVLLVVLIILTGATAFMAYSAFNTVQVYAAKFTAIERDLATFKPQTEKLRADADKLRADTDAVGGRVKKVEDEIARVRR